MQGGEPVLYSECKAQITTFRATAVVAKLQCRVVSERAMLGQPLTIAITLLDQVGADQSITRF